MNADTLLEEKHNLNIELSNHADELNKTKVEFAMVEIKLEELKNSKYLKRR